MHSFAQEGQATSFSEFRVQFCTRIHSGEHELSVKIIAVMFASGYEDSSSNMYWVPS